MPINDLTDGVQSVNLGATGSKCASVYGAIVGEAGAIDGDNAQGGSADTLKDSEHPPEFTRTSALSLKYHSPIITPLPLNTASTDTIALISSTGTTHIASRMLLSTHSSFFSSLFSLPPPLTASDEPEVEPIPLPSASPAGLTLILAVLESLDINGKFSPAAYKYWMKITVEDLVVVAEAAICADAYDIPIFDIVFVRPIYARLDHDPILQFAFAAVTKLQKDLAGIARSTLSSAASHRPEIPHDVGQILRNYAPDQYSRLSALHAAYPSARHRLQQRLRNHQHPSEPEGFSRRCDGKCLSFEEEKNWKSMKANAAERLYERVVADLAEAFGSQYWIRVIVADGVSCSVCATRLSKTFEWPVSDFLKACDGY